MASTITAAAARKLCSKTELTLVQASYATNVRDLTPSQLRQKITRARKLRDKYRDLAKQQRGESRGKRKPQSTRAAQSDENTVRKATLFQETLDRLEQQLARKEKTSTMKTKKTSAKKATTPATSARSPSAAKSSSKTSAKKAGASADGSKSKKKSHASSKAAPAAKAARTPKPRGRKTKASVAMAATGASLGATPTGQASASGWPGAMEQISSRKTRRQDKSNKATYGATQSQFAATSTQKMQGHVSGQTKRRQAKRDA